MSKARQTFKPGDVTKAIKAMVKAGLGVERVEYYVDKFVIITGKPEELPANENETSADLRKLL
jgi:hypothetical protein